LKYIRFSDTPADSFYRAYASYYLGDYRNAILDLRHAWDNSTDAEFRNRVARAAIDFQQAATAASGKR
jgi:hypothetical protein